MKFEFANAGMVLINPWAINYFRKYYIKGVMNTSLVILSFLETTADIEI